MSPEANKKNRRRTKIVSAIFFFIPKGNPDFEGELDEVTEWQIEFDANTELPNREIGIDENGKVICIMPWKNNVGFWTDLDMTLDDYIERFDPEPIEEEEFNSNWEKFLNNRKTKF